jgi:hypothetical protein
MSKLELLANDIAFLNDDNLLKLAMILVKDYPTRADALDAKINVAFFDTDVEAA